MSVLSLVKRTTGIGVLLALVALLVLLFKPIPTTVAPIQPRADTEYWSMPGGYRIAYTRIAPDQSSEPAQTPVLFLHGGPGGYIHSSVIDTLRPLAAQGYDLYLYDQSGSGLSDRRARPKDTTIATHLSDLADIVDQIGGGPVVLIGHSFGGLLAALYAADHPGDVAGLVLSGPGEMMPLVFNDDGQWANALAYPDNGGHPFLDVSQTYARDTSIARLPVRAIASLAVAQLFNARFAPDHELDNALNTMAAGFTHNMVCNPENVRPEEGGGGAYSRTGTNFFPDGFVDRRDAMRTFSAPVLILHGQCDFLPYAAVYEYADLFPNSRYVFMEGAGHIIYWDTPGAYAGQISEFLRTLSP